MGLETVTYPDDLIVTNPDGASDPKSQGDDHIKNIKKAIKNAWPGIAGRVGSKQTKSANYTIALTDAFRWIHATADMTLSLTAAATLGDGFEFYVDAIGGSVTLDPNGSELINGLTTETVHQFERYKVCCNGTAFYTYNLTQKNSRARFLPANVLGSYTLAYSTTITPPVENGWKLQGEGKVLSQLSYTGTGVAIDTLGNYTDKFANCQELRDFDLVGSASAVGGIRWVGRGRSVIDNILVEGFTGVGAYGLCFKESHTCTLNAVHLNGNYYGFYAPQPTDSGPNALAWNGPNIEGNTEAGIFVNSAAGWSFNGDQCGGNKTGHVYDLHGWGVAYNGGYAEFNTNTEDASEDHYFGRSSITYAACIRGRWLNGRAEGETYDYVPIRLGFVQGSSFGPNFLNVGNRVYDFVEGGSVTNCEFLQNAYGETFDLSDPRKVYSNMPATILMGGNRFKDYAVFPQGRNNWFAEGLGTLVPAPVNDSTWADTGTKDGAHPIYKWGITASGNGSLLTRQWAISASSNTDAKGRYLTVGFRVLTTSPSGKIISVYLDNTVEGATEPISFIDTDGVKQVYVSAYLPADSTVVRVILVADANSADFYISAPTLYVGMDKDVMIP